MSNSKQNPSPALTEELGTTKAGEYLLHVYIEETRALRHPKNEDQTINPVVQIEAFGKKRVSKVKQNIGTGATFWGDHFFFEKNFGTTYEFEVEKLTISILDHSSFGFNALIGTVEFNISAIYSKDKHCLLYQWAALSGLTKNFQKILGFLKFSIGIFTSNDEQIHLDQEKVTSENVNFHALNVLYPPQIITQPYQLRVKVFRGEKLKKMDTFGKADPFVQVEYGSIATQTSILKITLDPVWNEELLIPISLPTINNKIVVRLFDWEQAQKNELMGSTTFMIEDILEKKYKNPFWVNMYGSHSKTKVTYYADMMNNVPAIASSWKGRIQLALTLEMNPQPIVGTFPIKDPKIVEGASKGRRDKFDLRAEIHYALNLPKNDNKYHLRIRWGKLELTTNKINSRNRMVEFYETLIGTEEFPYENLESTEIPDILVYLNDGDKDFSFIRKDFLYFSDPFQKPKPIFFQNDKSLTEKRDDLAGVVKMKIYVNKAGENQQAIAQAGWNKRLEKRFSPNEWRVHLNIYQARDLISGDESGLSDAFLQAYFYGSEARTTVIKDTVNPIWNERLEFVGYFDDIEEAPPIMLTLWDEDNMSNDFLGTAIVNIDKNNINPDILPSPKWIAFRYGKSGQEAGEVLLSVCCYRPEHLPRSPYIEPEVQKYFINMKILGLRNLESFGLLPIKRAFVKFDINSLKRRQEKSVLPEKKMLRTEPIETGSNPNILTVINLEVLLPIDPTFCPALECTVFDCILKGASQPRIGNFAIPLGEYMIETSKELKKRIDTLTSFYRSNQEEFMRSPQIKIENKQGNLAAMEQIDIIIDKDTVADGKEFETLLISDDPVKKAQASNNFLIISHLDKNGIETNTPDLTKFLTLGYNSKDKSSQKHYRFIVKQELEKSNLIDESSFSSIPIYRGKKATEQSCFTKMFSFVEQYRIIGHFKAMINIMSENDKIQFDSKIAAVSQFANTKGLEFSDEEFLKKTNVVVRLYLIEAEGLMDKDNNSNSDPYVIVKFGDKVYNESKNYQIDCPNPKFHKCYEFHSSIPGASKLSLQLWDHDDLTSDELIGTTEIDIEDRWFSKKWRSLKHIPIETRNLYNPASSLSQGSVKLWVEIYPRESKIPPIWAIAPKPPMDFEVRVVIWECKDVPRVDIEDASDIYVTATLDNGQEARTDTHFRSTNGKGSFNWRLVFDVSFPMKKHRVSFKIWDKDLLSKNDFIGEASFDFDAFALRAFENEETVNITPNKETKFWITCTRTKVENGKNITKNFGEVLISMSLVPKKQALLSPAGKGREAPNQNPYLPPPVGRFQWTWNPIKLFEQLVGPVARRTCCIVIFIVCLIIFAILLFPMVIANLITK